MSESCKTSACANALNRKRRGQRACAWGAEAELAVADVYRGNGAVLLERRKQTGEGEVDLILKMGDVIVFAEVKARRSLEQALAAAPASSWKRRGNAALAYAAEIGHSGDIRLDLAAVDRTGRVQIIENASMAASF